MVYSGGEKDAEESRHKAIKKGVNDMQGIPYISLSA